MYLFIYMVLHLFAIWLYSDLNINIFICVHVQCTASLDSSDTRRRGGVSDTQGKGGEGGGRSPLSARAGRDGAADPVRVAGALKL